MTARETANREAQKFVELCDRLKRAAPLVGVAMTGDGSIALEGWEQAKDTLAKELVRLLADLGLMKTHATKALEAYTIVAAERIANGDADLLRAVVVMALSNIKNNPKPEEK